MIPDNIRSKEWNDMDWSYIKGMSAAIEKVRKDYIRNKGDNKFHLEHVFAYELYYKWKVVLKQRGGNPAKLILNGELVKHYCMTSNYKFPDMVLHKSYKNNDEDEYQCIICEIKSSRNRILNNELKKDLLSLSGGINELSFKCGVFIYLGDNLKRMLNRLRKIMQELDIDANMKLLFIGVNGYKYHYEIL